MTVQKFLRRTAAQAKTSSKRRRKARSFAWRRFSHSGYRLREAVSL